MPDPTQPRDPFQWRPASGPFSEVAQLRAALDVAHLEIGRLQSRLRTLGEPYSGADYPSCEALLTLIGSTASAFDTERRDPERFVVCWDRRRNVFYTLGALNPVPAEAAVVLTLEPIFRNDEHGRRRRHWVVGQTFIGPWAVQSITRQAADKIRAEGLSKYLVLRQETWRPSGYAIAKKTGRPRKNAS